MRDLAEVGDTVWWPDERRLWQITAILTTRGGQRYLAIRRWEPDVETRVVPEHEVTSNAFMAPTGRGRHEARPVRPGLSVGHPGWLGPEPPVLRRSLYQLS